MVITEQLLLDRKTTVQQLFPFSLVSLQIADYAQIIESRGLFEGSGIPVSGL